MGKQMAGWLAAAQLQDWKLLIAPSIAAGLGLVMILPKDLVLIHRSLRTPLAAYRLAFGSWRRQDGPQEATALRF